MTVEANDRDVSFTVDDTGSGIAPAHLPHVFERYWNADPRGIGLGLYIARSIVRAHGGEITVRSTLGAGSSFVFTVPRAAMPERAPGRTMRLRQLLGR